MGYKDLKQDYMSFVEYRYRPRLPFLRCPWTNCGHFSPPWVWLIPIGKVGMMIKKKILNPDRIRRIDGGFSFIPHRFLSDGFLAAMQQKELLLYLFLIIASDRHGLSFYSYDSICSLLQMDLDQYISARNGLIDKDLINFDGTVFQVLDLPTKPVISETQQQSISVQKKNQAAIARIIDQSIKSL